MEISGLALLLSEKVSLPNPSLSRNPPISPLMVLRQRYRFSAIVNPSKVL